MILANKTGEECRKDVDGLTGLVPTLNGQTSDEAEPPPLGDADRLEIGGRADDFAHGRRIF